MPTDLSDAYAVGAHIPDGDAYPARWTAASQAFRDRLGARAQTGLRYGPAVRETYDLFLPEGAAQGTLIFVHGGYWKGFAPGYWSSLAEGPLAHGWAVAMPAYTLAPEARIGQITRQVAGAVAAIAAARAEGPLVICGHSAGGHLAARMLAPGMLPPAVAARVVRGMPMSPLADLRPLLQTEMNAVLRLDAAEALAESPALSQPVPPMPVHVWVGGDERPVFLDQARWLAKAWDADLTVVPGRHHFDLLDDMEDPGSDLVRWLTGG